ncbi:hypothetical protein [Intestinibacter sp.]|uniref:hypothetical protein n=1 Tax=Intestinibacter sp. TaxID=1965304 RepID=UPI002A7554F8|nr:hypothetical protein [Intestinibacter sp.]MDY2736532.1 hypothetical protein [Intestinibacter sp.]
MDINYINKLLEEGKTVKEIREILGIGEKSFQKQIKKLNYKYNQKMKRYEPISEVLNTSLTNNSNNEIKELKRANDKDMIFDIPGEMEPEAFKKNIISLAMNYEKIKKMLDDYEHIFSIQNNDIVEVQTGIKIDDPGDEVERTTVRVGKNILKKWNEFCDRNKQFSKKDLLGQAMLEFIQKYDK